MTSNDHDPNLFLFDPPSMASQPNVMGPTYTARCARALSKRVVDVCLSLPVVFVILPPLALFVRFGHWWQSPGPLFFRQERRGYAGRPFTILKFRTMNAPEDGGSDISGNPATRIFPFGSFLRNTKLDEIPQFVNVLVGSMSIVGPRPHHFADCEKFQKLVRGYSHRTAAKPGITGLAQYTEYRGEFEWNCVESRVDKDLSYIQQWSLGFDVRLILGTIIAVVQNVSRGALRRFAPRLFPTPVSGNTAIVPIPDVSVVNAKPSTADEVRRAA